jgi:archaellum component FlaF (FlaF/FlaG flagellin family)
MAIQRIQFRRGTTAQWASENPILAIGEPGIELRVDNSIAMKVGDGSTNWATLPYHYSEDFITESELDAALAALVDSAPSTLDTLNEIAAALGDDPNLATTLTTAIGNKADASHTHDASEITNTLIEVSSSPYTIQASDNGKMLVVTDTNPIDIVIDDVFAVGNRVDIYLRSATTVTFSAGTGTVESSALTMADQYTVASILCVASGIYTVVGNVA